MKKIIYLIIVLVVISGCGMKYSNEEAIANLDKITKECTSTKPKFIELTEEEVKLNMYENDTFIKVSTESGIYKNINYEYKNIGEGLAGTFVTNFEWKKLFGDKIELKAIDGSNGEVMVVKKTKNWYRMTVFSTGWLHKESTTIAYLDKNQYRIENNIFSYLYAGKIMGSLRHYKGPIVNQRYILYQVDIDFNNEPVTANIKILAYKSFLEGKQIEEKYFY